MRTIDADALYRRIGDHMQQYYDYDKKDIGLSMLRGIQVDAISSVLEMVVKAPTVDPVVHAHWIEDGECQICSNCGEEHNWIDYRAAYCENCGAKMDGEEP